MKLGDYGTDNASSDTVTLSQTVAVLMGSMRVTRGGLEAEAGKAVDHEEPGVLLHGGPVEKFSRASMSRL